MPNQIPYNDKFCPSYTVRESWLSTRKHYIPSGSVQLPGFYQTIGYEKDRSFFRLALIIEIIAVFLTIKGGYNKGWNYFLIALIGVVLFIFFDFAGAYLCHKNIGKKCLNLNRSLDVLDTNPAASEAYFKEANKLYPSKIIGLLLIYISAALKIVAILLLGRFTMIFYVIFTILYLFVIYIHIYHTGYYFAEWWTSKKLNKELHIWFEENKQFNEGQIPKEKIKYNINGPTVGSPLDSDVVLNFPDNSNEIHVGLHKLVKAKGDIKKFKYTLETIGILTDSEIMKFLQNQNSDQSKVIGMLCLNHQLSKIHP